MAAARAVATGVLGRLVHAEGSGGLASGPAGIALAYHVAATSGPAGPAAARWRHRSRVTTWTSGGTGLFDGVTGIAAVTALTGEPPPAVSRMLATGTEAAVAHLAAALRAPSMLGERHYDASTGLGGHVVALSLLPRRDPARRGLGRAARALGDLTTWPVVTAADEVKLPGVGHPDT